MQQKRVVSQDARKVIMLETSPIDYRLEPKNQMIAHARAATLVTRARTAGIVDTVPKKAGSAEFVDNLNRLCGFA
jgi:hypothetical protein